MTASLPARAILCGYVTFPSTQALTASLPARALKTGTTNTVNTASATFSIPAYLLLVGDTFFQATTQALTFSVPAYAINRGWVLVASTAAATFSTIARTLGLGTGVSATPSTPSAAFTIPAYAIVTVRNIIIAASTLAMTMTVATISKVGAVWSKRGRSTDANWTRTGRNST
jgi:hypothetical protein